MPISVSCLPVYCVAISHLAQIQWIFYELLESRILNLKLKLFLPRDEQSDQEATWGWGGEVGLGRPAGKKGHNSPLAPDMGGPATSPYGAPNGQGQLGIPPPPLPPVEGGVAQGPQYGMEVGKWGLPTSRPGGGVSDQPRGNRPLIVQMGFCPPLGVYNPLLLISSSPSSLLIIFKPTFLRLQVTSRRTEGTWEYTNDEECTQLRSNSSHVIKF